MSTTNPSLPPCTSNATEALLDLIAPFYKSFPTPGSPPSFRRTLTSEEIQDILMGVHNIISSLLSTSEKDQENE